MIYDLLDDVRDTMIGMLEARQEEVLVGRAEVRALFQSSRVGVIAGCYVAEGRLVRGAMVRVRRGGGVVYEGQLESLRHLRDDASELRNLPGTSGDIARQLRGKAIARCSTPELRAALDGAGLRNFAFQARRRQRIYQFDASRGVRGFPKRPEGVLKGWR